MKNSNSLLDIAILTAGRSDLFDKCVDAVLAEMSPDYRVQVCNNGHPSQEYENTYKKLPPNSVIKRKNVDDGFGAGANTVINSGKSPLVLFVTDDIFIHRGAIDKLVRTMDDPSISLCGYKFLFPEDSDDLARPAGKVQHIGMATTITGEMVHPMIGWSADNPKCNVSRDVVAVTGASFMVRRDIFRRVGGFDLVYGKGYYEDTDLCFKIRAQGGRVFVNTESTATHGTGQTFKNEKNPAPIHLNAAIFKSRWFNTMAWSEWLMY